MSTRPFCRIARPTCGFPQNVARAAFAVILSVYAFSSAGAVTVSAGIGFGVPTAMRGYLRTSRAFELTTFARLTEAASLGLLADYTQQPTRTAATTSYQERLLLVVRWTWGERHFPNWFQPFGQLGAGGGYMEYAGPSLVEHLNAPAGRLGIGANVRISRRFAIVPTLSYDRLEAASIQAERRYPTMLALRCSAAFSVLGDKPLLVPAR
ncbi:MAG: hypothetical protein BWY06_00598 [Candidatus Latescibacteria bacterium ADurb.Bin168]|nr:MAG: hypothetical protein BWY06_00598 [Candidatus Latescibacteria bacterium ADurb.Bin168]